MLNCTLYDEASFIQLLKADAKTKNPYTNLFPIDHHNKII